MLSPEPKMEKNHLVALVLCMIVLMVYPFVLKKYGPQAPVLIEENTAAEITPNLSEPIDAAAEEAVSALTPAESTVFKTPQQPAVVQFENDLYKVTFSTLGATVTELVYKGDPGRREISNTKFFETDFFQPGLFGVSLAQEAGDLSRTIFKLNRQENNIFEFVFEKPGDYRLQKQYIVSNEDPIIGLNVTVSNLAPRERHFPLELDIDLDNPSHERIDERYFEAVGWTDKAITANIGKIRKKGWSVADDMKWAGLVKKYFALLVKPDLDIINVDARGKDERISMKMSLAPVSIQGNQSKQEEFFIYAGPQRYEYLESFGVGFENILSRGFFGLFKIWVLKSLKFSHEFTHNFGWDILLLTLIIKLLFAPLTHMSYKSMERMKALQPKQKALQEKYKENPQKMNQEMMALYKKHKVNPLGGCLPMLCQIPVFIAFYQVLGETIELRGAPFIGWITDLSQPDRLVTFAHSFPIIGDSFNLLPLLMMASMVIQQKMTPQSGVSAEQQKIFQFMPVIFGFIFYKMPSGLVLYWFLSNVLSILQQIYVRSRHAVLHHHDDEA